MEGEGGDDLHVEGAQPQDAALWRACPVHTTPPEQAAREEVASLRARGARMIVALLHLGPSGAAHAFLQAVPGIDYSLFEAPSGPGGGVGGLQPGNWQPGVINYLSVPSVDEYQEKVKKAGGKILMPKADVMGQGWFAIFEDPSGTRMALWQQNPNAPRV